MTFNWGREIRFHAAGNNESYTFVNPGTIKCAVDEEKKEVAAIKVRRNYLALQRSIPELAYLSPERLAEIAGLLATAPL